MKISPLRILTFHSLAGKISAYFKSSKSSYIELAI